MTSDLLQLCKSAGALSVAKADVVLHHVTAKKISLREVGPAWFDKCSKRDFGTTYADNSSRAVSFQKSSLVGWVVREGGSCKSHHNVLFSNKDISVSKNAQETLMSVQLIDII